MQDSKADNDNDTAMTNTRNDNVEDWDYKRIIEWIMSLEDGLFLVYKEIVQERLSTDITGKELLNADEEMINSWGIDKFVHVKLIYHHIKSLTTSEGV